MPEPLPVVLSCEHASRSVPRAWRTLFRGRRALLASHRGWDPGALALARVLARALSAPLFAARVTRLLVDCNRSPGHPRRFSELSRLAPRAAREALLERYYHPYRELVYEAAARALSERGAVLHLSVHTFTPVLDGVRRAMDVGLLYDPARTAERTFCMQLRQRIQACLPDVALRRNAPYRGTADSLVASLRESLGPAYLGVELEVNQRFPLEARGAWRRLKAGLALALAQAARCGCASA